MTTLSTQPTSAGSPPARRLPTRRWRDWRLLLGVLLVLASAVAGARLVAASDDTVPTWAAGTALVPGAPLREEDLQLVPVRVDGPANPYLTGAIPAGYVVVRAVGAGELLPAQAVAPAAQARSASRLVAVAVDPAGLPGRLAVGDAVDVWAVTDQVAGSDAPAELLAAEVPVVEVPATDGGWSAGTSRSVVLGVDAGSTAATTDLVARLVAASAAGRVVLTAAPGVG